MAKGAYVGVNTKIYPQQTTVGNLDIGSIIKINENGSPVDYIIVHQGNPDSSMYDASCDGTWVLRKEVYQQVQWHTSNYNDYANSYVHSYLNSTFLNLFDSNVKTKIKTAKIPYFNGVGTTGSVASGSNGLSTQIFLLSSYEVGFNSSTTNNISNEGSVLSYFNGTSSQQSEESKRVAYSGSVGCSWWLRSIVVSSSTSSWCVGTTGSTGSSGCSSTAIYIRPAFILPSNLSLTNNVVTGAEAPYTTKSVARKVKGGYIGINSLVYSAPIIGDIQVGSTVKVNENGTPTDYIIVHKGNPNTALYDSSCDGVWLLRADVYTTSSQWHAEKTKDYSQSTAHSYLNNTYLSVLDSSLQSTIKSVNIPYHKTIDSVTSGTLNSLSTKIFLLSGYEVGLTSSSFREDGAILNYFKDVNHMSATPKRAASNRWWLRSPQWNSSDGYVSAVNMDGGFTGATLCTGYIGYRPAFIVPSNTAITSNGIISGIATLTRKNVARRIKKAYIGIGGVARPCWSGGGKPTYYGTINAPDTPRHNVASAKAGSYALFAGGEPGNGSVAGISIVDAYDENYTSYAPSDLQVARTRMAGTSIGNYALFGGGSSNSTPYSYVDAYDEDLTRTALTSLSWSADLLQAATVGDKAIFNGGAYCTNTNAYNSQLTRLDAPSTGVCHANHAAGSTANYALFACGLHAYSVMYAYVEAYDADLTKHDADMSSSNRSHFFGANVGDYLLFAGGYTAYTGGSTTASVDAYNDALTKTVAPNLHAAKQGAGGASLGNYALFVGGYTGSANVANAEAYDGNLQKTTLDPIGTANNMLPSVTLGESALFFSYDNVEVYTLM